MNSETKEIRLWKWLSEKAPNVNMRDAMTSEELKMCEPGFFHANDPDETIN